MPFRSRSRPTLVETIFCRDGQKRSQRRKRYLSLGSHYELECDTSTVLQKSRSKQSMSWCTPRILGFAKPPLRDHVHHALSEATLSIEEGEMLLRWGIMPANGTIDPNVLPPVPMLSWILDIDVSSGAQRAFENTQLNNSFRALAERAYSVFRFMTTNKFLAAFGGAT